MIPKYKITELQHSPDKKHPSPWSYLSNGALYAKATGKTMEEDPQLSHHRALDDSKAERTWMQKLQPMTDLLFGEGAQQRPSVRTLEGLTVSDGRAVWFFIPSARPTLPPAVPLHYWRGVGRGEWMMI